MAVRVTCTTSVEPTLRANLEGVAGKVRGQFVDAIVADARRYAPVDTGLLASRITGNKTAGTITADTPYAAAQEFGAEEHLIEHAFGRDGWAGIVVHPGNAAQPYLRPALNTKRSF